METTRRHEAPTAADSAATAPTEATSQHRPPSERDFSRSSRLPGFYELPRSERLRSVQAFSGLNEADLASLGNLGTLNGELLEVFIENGLGSFSLPLGVATNFYINGRDVLVPMAVEETSVLAAASHGATDFKVVPRHTLATLVQRLRPHIGNDPHALGTEMSPGPSG